MLQPFSDEYFMKKAMDEALLALSKNEVPVGAVVVSGKQIIGKGHNLTELLQDVTAHAEMLAITAAANFLGAKYLENCKIYVTLEPCAMCAAAINAAQMAEVIYATPDPKRGYNLYHPPLLHAKIKIQFGIMAEECSRLLQEFFRKKRN